MKTTHRSIPNDIFSVEENGESICITTYKGWINVTLSRDGVIRKADQFCFLGFLNSLQRLCADATLSPPSPDDKEAATALPKGELGHSGFKIGDKVLIPSDHGSVGFITKIRDLGMVDVQTIDGRELTRPVHCLQPRL